MTRARLLQQGGRQHVPLLDAGTLGGRSACGRDREVDAGKGRLQRRYRGDLGSHLTQSRPALGIRCGRPGQRHGGCLHLRVHGILRGFGRPVDDVPEPVEARLVHGRQEAVRSASSRLGRSPPVPGDGQPVLGTGEGHVREPLALELAQSGEHLPVLVVVLRPRALPCHRERREVGRAVIAQRPRNRAGAGGPLGPAATAGERPRRDERHEDVGELQTLGLVDGQQLHCVRGASHLQLQVDVEPLRVAKARQERPQGEPAVQLGEVGGEIEEGMQGVLLLGRGIR